MIVNVAVDLPIGLGHDWRNGNNEATAGTEKPLTIIKELPRVCEMFEGVGRDNEIEFAFRQNKPLKVTNLKANLVAAEVAPSITDTSSVHVDAKDRCRPGRTQGSGAIPCPTASVENRRLLHEPRKEEVDRGVCNKEICVGTWPDGLPKRGKAREDLSDPIADTPCRLLERSRHRQLCVKDTAKLFQRVPARPAWRCLRTIGSVRRMTSSGS